MIAVFGDMRGGIWLGFAAGLVTAALLVSVAELLAFPLEYR